MKPVLPEQAGIKSLYAANFLHAALWSFVSAQRRCGKGIDEAIRDFMQFIAAEDLEFNSLKMAYHRKNNDYIRCANSMSTDAKSVFHSESDEMSLIFSAMRIMIKKQENG
jgi:hypothetical protein